MSRKAQKESLRRRTFRRVPRSSVSTQDLYQEHTLREFRMYISELKTL